VVIEKDHFPRFHIGESLIPGVMPLFEELGLGEPLGREGFLPKYAAEFLLADGSTKRRYRFSDALEAGPDRALEVGEEQGRVPRYMIHRAFWAFLEISSDANEGL
jgi:hypothetical protein